MNSVDQQAVVMSQQSFLEIEKNFFTAKKIYDEGGMSNSSFSVWNDLYDCACSLIAIVNKNSYEK